MTYDPIKDGAGELKDASRPPGPDCADRAAYGDPSAIDQYMAKPHIIDQSEYPADACPTYYYSKAQIDDFKINTTLTGAANINMSGNITGAEVSTTAGVTLSSRKDFDIPHPSKEGWRLRHVCLEGPESAVYFRGRVKNKKIIYLPLYWKDLVDWTTITVSLTPIGAHQDIIVKRFDDEKIYLQSNGGLPIDCFFHVYGERSDGERLIAEYEGTTIDDYPGDNSIYSINK